MSDDAITEADVAEQTIQQAIEEWATIAGGPDGPHTSLSRYIAARLSRGGTFPLDRLRAQQCPLGLDARPMVCSAGTCAVCQGLRDLEPSALVAGPPPLRAQQAGWDPEFVADTLRGSMDSELRERMEVIEARAQQAEPTSDEESICATCEGSGCACHPGGQGHPKGLIGWSPCPECGGSGRSAETASRVVNPFLDLGEPATPFHDREPQPSDGPDYHADHAAWVSRQPAPDEDTVERVANVLKSASRRPVGTRGLWGDNHWTTMARAALAAVPPPARPDPQATDDGSIPPCSAEASLCGGTPGDCWNHVAVDGRCYRADAALDETPIGVIARQYGLRNAVALLASLSDAGFTLAARPDHTEDVAMLRGIVAQGGAHPRVINRHLTALADRLEKGDVGASEGSDSVSRSLLYAQTLPENLRAISRQPGMSFVAANSLRSAADLIEGGPDYTGDVM